MSIGDINDPSGTGPKKLPELPAAVPGNQPMTEAQYLEDLRRLQTNFLFLYGDHQAGKTAICSSLIYYLMTHPQVGKFSDRIQQSQSGQDFIRKAIGKVSEKRFIGRTALNSVTLSGGRFEPARSGYESIPITFMEMAGEDLRHLVAPHGTVTFPQHIDVFLQDKDLSLVFMLIIKHSTVTHEKDLMLADFIDYLRSKDERFRSANVLLLVSQWDSYKGDKSLEQFVATYLPLTYAAMTGQGNSISSYSVGDVTQVDGEPYISRLDNESPERLVRWIYKNITGKDLFARSFWQRLIDLIR